MGLVERIKRLCEEKGTSFAEVERKVGISNGQIRRWNKSSPKIENVKRVAEFFNVSLDYLAGLDEEVNDWKQHVTSEDLIQKFEDENFDVDYVNEDGSEKIYINHSDHGTVDVLYYSDFLERGHSVLRNLKEKYNVKNVQTIAAHHEGEEWTDEEKEEIERFKEFVRLKRKQQGD